MVATPEGRDSLRKAEWITSSNAWTYMRWSSKHRKLVADETREPMVHDEAVRIITELQKQMKGEIIHKFQSTVNLAKLEEQGAQQAIFHLGVSLRGLRGHGSLRAVPEAHGTVTDKSRGIQHEGGRPSTSPDDTTAGSDDLRWRPGDLQLASSHTINPDTSNPPAGSATNNSHPAPNHTPSSATIHNTRHTPLPKFYLSNPNNHCYLNATIYCLALLECRLQKVILPATFQHADNRLLNALKALGFNLLGWRRPERQHDVAELIDFLVPRLCPSQAHHTWSAKTAHEGGVHQVDGAALSKCLSLSNLTIDNPDLQVLVNQWYQQAEAHALDSTVPWLFLQLPRSSRDEQGNITKNHKPIIIPKVLQLPVFESPHTLEPRWQPYHLIACILHHGPLLTSGHYSVLSIGGAQSHVLDDEKPRVPATNAFLESASCSAYVLVLALDMSDSSQSRLAQNDDSSDVGREREWDESLLAEEIRGHMDSSTLESHGVPAERARGADDADATTRRQHSGADAHASAARPSSLVLVQQQSYEQSSNDQSACLRHA